MVEHAPRVGAGVARRHGRRRARDPDHLVGRQAEPEMRAQVRVEVDEPGRDELAGRVDALDGAIGGDARRHRGDLAVLDPMSRLPRSRRLGSRTSPPAITSSYFSAGSLGLNPRGIGTGMTWPGAGWASACANAAPAATAVDETRKLRRDMAMDQGPPVKPSIHACHSAGA